MSSSAHSSARVSISASVHVQSRLAMFDFHYFELINFLLFSMQKLEEILCAGCLIIAVMYVRVCDTTITYFRGSSPLPICDCVPSTLFDTTSLGGDYVNEVVSIQGRAHIADVGQSPLTLFFNMKICGLDLG